MRRNSPGNRLRTIFLALIFSKKGSEQQKGTILSPVFHVAGQRFSKIGTPEGTPPIFENSVQNMKKEIEQFTFAVLTLIFSKKALELIYSEYLWFSTKSGGYADIKIIAIRCVDRNKIAKIIDHVQKSLWPLIFLDIQGDLKSEFWVVLRVNFCFKVLQVCEKWSEWHVLGIYDVLQGQGVTLI